MLDKNGPKSKITLLSGVIAVFLLGVVVAVGSMALGASMEQHDSFCASCHSQPESTFYQRSIAAQPADMASFHTTQKVNCIDCHSGSGLMGRVQAEMLGGRNALVWYSGAAKQPSVQTTPISDANCLKCHQDVVKRGFSAKEQIAVPSVGGGEEGNGRSNHWHEFLTRWQTASPATAATCTSCHNGHATGGTAQSGFMVDQSVQKTCEACHAVLKRD